MQRIINTVKVFYRKNRLLLIIGLGFILMMQICGEGGKVNTMPAERHEHVQNRPDDTDLKPLREIESQDRRTTHPELISLFTLMALVLLFYAAAKRGRIKKTILSIVWVSLRIKRHKQSKERMATLSIVNHTKESITFMSPVISFGSVFKKSRKFRLKSGAGQAVFPLTLTPGTSHRMAINLDAFRQKAGGLSAYVWVRFEIDGNNQKTHTSLWKYLF